MEFYGEYLGILLEIEGMKSMINDPEKEIHGTI